MYHIDLYSLIARERQEDLMRQAKMASWLRERRNGAPPRSSQSKSFRKTSNPGLQPARS